MLNIRDEQIQHTKRLGVDDSSVNKYKQKIKDLERHYEARIAELVDELRVYKRSGHSRAALKSDGTKSSRSIKKASNKTQKEHLATGSTFGRGYDHDTSYREDVDLDTDITPAEELNSADRRRMVEKAENIGNDSLLISFYKKKIEDNKHKKVQEQSYTHRTSAPLKPRDENIDREADSSHMNSVYIQSSSQRYISGYMPKHYQIPKKEGSSHLDQHRQSEVDPQEILEKAKDCNVR